MKAPGIVLGILLYASNSAFAQVKIDMDRLVEGLNGEIQTIMPGVTTRNTDGDPAFGGFSPEVFFGTPSVQHVPDFAIVARDSNNEVVEIFGPNTPYTVENGQVVIPGYTPPEGGKLGLAGAETWMQTLGHKAGTVASAPSMDQIFEPLVGLSEVVQQATMYLADQLCQAQGRPSEMSMYLTAEFKFIVGGETGTEITWNFDEICTRLGLE